MFGTFTKQVLARYWNQLNVRTHDVRDQYKLVKNSRTFDIHCNHDIFEATVSRHVCCMLYVIKQKPTQSYNKTKVGFGNTILSNSVSISATFYLSLLNKEINPFFIPML